MPSPIEELTSYIVSRTREVWEGSKEPYFLSQITPETRSKGLDYKDIIGPITLKEFVATLSDDITLVVHPRQRAKIGIIPKGESFKFEQDSELQTTEIDKSSSKPARNFSSKYAVMNFLQALAKLDDKELEKIDIPVSILARLMQDR